MNILAVNPGASYSTMDVHRGYVGALRRLGHTVREYCLDQRIDDVGHYYKSLYRRKKLGPLPAGLVATKACSDIIPHALYHNVDGVLIVSGMYLQPDTLVMLRRAHIPTAMMLTESPYDDEKQARVIPWVDAVFTNERTSVDYLRQFNANTRYLPHAHDPETHHPRTPLDGWEDGYLPQHDVVFVGTLFEERIDLLAGVDWDGIDLGLYGAHELLPSRHRLRKYIKGGVTDNARAAALYRRAKIGLNLYRTSRGFGVGVEHIDHAESLSPRAVELAACGCYHLSEDRAEVREVFGEVVPTFRTAAELGALVRHSLDYPDGRAAVSRYLPGCVEHLTFDRQAETLVSMLRDVWSGAGMAAGVG